MSHRIPTSSFALMSVEDSQDYMAPTTRSQAAAQQRSRHRRSQRDDPRPSRQDRRSREVAIGSRHVGGVPRRSTPQTISPEHHPSFEVENNLPALQASSGLCYKVDGLDQQALHMANSALANNPKIDVARCYQDDATDRYRFNIIEQVEVTFDPPAGRSIGVPMCSCGTDGPGVICRHIWWLIDRILQGYIGDAAPPGDFLVSDSGANIVFVNQNGHSAGRTTFDLLENGTFGQIAARHHWTISDVADDERILADLVDCLSVLVPEGLLPVEIWSQDRASGRSTESTLFRQFYHTIQEQVKHDARLNGLRDLISPSTVLSTSILRLRGRLHSIFAAYESFYSNEALDDARQYSVRQCAQELQKLVESTASFFRHRLDKQKGLQRLRTEVANIVVEIVAGVLTHRGDAFASRTPLPFVGESEPRDLYAFLLLDDPNPDLGIGALEDVVAVGAFEADKLEDLVGRLEACGAPRLYTARLQRIVNACEA